MIFLIVIIVESTWLWACYTTFSKDNSEHILKMMLIVIVATIPGLLIGLISFGFKSPDVTAIEYVVSNFYRFLGNEVGAYSSIISNFARYVVIYLVMIYMFQIRSHKTILKIIAMNYAGRAFLHLFT